MKRKRIIYILVFIVLIFLNGYVLLHRNDGYKYYPLKTYSQVYQPDSSFFIENIFFKNDSVLFSFSQKPVTDQYFLNNKKVLVAGHSISFPLQKNFHTYTLVSVAGRSQNIIFHIDHSENPQGIFTNEFLYSNIPGPGISTTPLHIWEEGIHQYSNNEVAGGRELLRKRTKISGALTDSARFMEIASFIAGIHSDASGIPIQAMNNLTPYQQILKSLESKTQLDCGNFSQMLAFLCDIENLPNRRITYRGPDGNWRFGVHYMNEIYLREKQTWILADALNNIYWPHDSLHVYNAADIKKIVEVNGMAGKKVFTFQGDSLLVKNYSDLSYWHEYYNTSNASIAYLFGGKELKKNTWNDLLQFYTFIHHEVWYNDNKQNNWPLIMLKLISFYALLILVIMGIFSGSGNSLQRKRKIHIAGNLKDV
ncbi:MAG: hypothetical protein WAU24_01215 [Chitinophagaceae bacterium]